MEMKSARLKTPSGRKTTLRFRRPPKDPVEVYCRLRPLTNNEIPCIWQVSETTVCVMPPANSQVFNKDSAKESTYGFKRVFNEDISQEEVFNCVALPLLKDVLNGKSGLLFTYGVTSSGKTFTMMGSPTDCGILPRCLDVIFASILHLQTKKCVFRPVGANNFEIVPTPEVLLQEHTEKINPKIPEANMRVDSDDWSQRVVETTIVDSLKENYGYAIFVSFIEIYNNNIYDLLDESGKGKRKALPKNLREDKRQFMYVNGGIEIEVKSAEDAFKVLCKGVKRRRVAPTALNTESSRGHSVFTIRVVKAPLDPQGIEVWPNPEFIVVSQLSLVDLAGSERSSRTRGDQGRTRETGNINNSLSTLRRCMEILRENQKKGTSTLVPYRESKLTHLFKNFFDEEGRIRMIICVNPRPEDHNETVFVMKFGEVTQEVCVTRPMGHPPLAPRFEPYGRGRPTCSRTLSSESDRLSPSMHCIRPTIPKMTLRDAEDATSIPAMIQILRERQQHRDCLVNDFMSRKDELRMRIVEIEEQNSSLQQRNILMERELEQKASYITCIEERLFQTQSHSEEIQRQLRELESEKTLLEVELDLKCQQLNEANNAIAQLQERLRLQRGEFSNSVNDSDLLMQPGAMSTPNARSTEVTKRYNLRSSAGGVKEKGD